MQRPSNMTALTDQPDPAPPSPPSPAHLHLRISLPYHFSSMHNKKRKRNTRQCGSSCYCATSPKLSILLPRESLSCIVQQLLRQD